MSDRKGLTGDFAPWPMTMRQGDPAITTSDILPAAILCATMIQSAQLFDLFVPNATRVAYVIQLIGFAWYMGIAAWRGRFGVFAAGALTLSFLIFEHMVFVRNSGAPANFSAIFGQITLVSFVAFTLCGTSLQRVLRIMLLVSAGYCLLYVAGQHTLLAATAGSAPVATGAENSHGSRVYLSVWFAAYVVFYALADRRMYLPVRIALGLLGAIALWLSGSRTFQLLFVVVFLVGWSKAEGRTTRGLLFALFAAFTLALLAGFLFESWNPFSYLAFDDSAWYRAREYGVALRAVEQHWLFGIGTPSDIAAADHLLGTPRYSPLYWTDLGALGPFVQWGLVGLVIYVCVIYACVTGVRGQSRIPEIRALLLTCLVCGLDGMISPAMLLDPACVFAMLLMALYLRQYDARERLSTSRPDLRHARIGNDTASTGSWTFQG